VVGSTNSLLLAQRDRYCDVLVNVRLLFGHSEPTDASQLDENLINISSQQLRQTSGLTVPDRRWIDFITQTVRDTWDECT
jgi:Transport protein Avl9